MKTRLYTRKRALISSVAMLLVAMIALGTATFAWFTKSTKATASGVSVETSKTSNLEISKADKVWGTTVDYETEATLMPTSTENGVDWVYAEAEAKTAYAVKNGVGGTAVPAGQAANYYFKEQLNVKNSGEAAVDATIKFNLKNATAVSNTQGETSFDGKYLRLALVDVTSVEGAATANKIVNPVATTFQSSIYDTEGETNYHALKATGVSTVDLTATNATETITIDVGRLTKDAAKYYNLYIWFEGNDQDCYDFTSGATLPSITFSVEGTNAPQTP